MDTRYNAKQMTKGGKTNISTRIPEDVDYSEEDKRRPLSFKTVHKHSYFIPSAESCTSETHALLVGTLVDAEMKNSLEKSSIINWCGNCNQLLPLKVSDDSCDFLDVISLLMWGIPDSQLFLRGILYLTACNSVGDFINIFYQYRKKSDDELRSGQKVHKENVWNRFKRFIKHGEASVDEEEYFLSMAIYILTNNLKRPIIVLTDAHANPGCPGGLYLPLERRPDECFQNPLIMAYYRKRFVPLVIQEVPSRNNVMPLMACYTNTPEMERSENGCTGNLKIKNDALPIPIRFVPENKHNSDLIVNYVGIFTDRLNNLFAKYNSEPSPEIWNPVFSAMMGCSSHTPEANVRQTTKSQNTSIHETLCSPTTQQHKTNASTEPYTLLSFSSMDNAIAENLTEYGFGDTSLEEHFFNETLQKNLSDQSLNQWVARSAGQVRLSDDFHSTVRNNLSVQYYQSANDSNVKIRGHVDDDGSSCRQNLTGRGQSLNSSTNSTHRHRIPEHADQPLIDPLRDRKNTGSAFSETRELSRGQFPQVTHMFNNNRQHCHYFEFIPASKCITRRCEMYGLPETGGMCSQCLKNYTLNNNVKTRQSNVNKHAPFPELHSTDSDLSLMGEKCANSNCRYYCSVYTHPLCYECICKYNSI